MHLAGMAEPADTRKAADVGKVCRNPTSVPAATTSDQTGLGERRESRLKNPLREICTVGSVRGCALKAHGFQFPEMETAAKPSSQPRTESCVMSGNGHCEAETGRLQAGTSVNDKIAPKSTVMEVADLIPQRGRQKRWMRYGKYPGMLPGFIPPACSQRILWEQGRSGPWGDIFRGYFAFTVRYGPMTCSPPRRWLCQ
jgi:hypothetical protein